MRNGIYFVYKPRPCHNFYLLQHFSSIRYNMREPKEWRQMREEAGKCCGASRVLHRMSLPLSERRPCCIICMLFCNTHFHALLFFRYAFNPIFTNCTIFYFLFFPFYSNFTLFSFLMILLINIYVF